VTRSVRELAHVWIPMSDGAHLGARIWLPYDSERAPVPAVLEYIPYRKGDGTAARDARLHPAVAAHGYACVRVDMRGSGESDGLLHDEYLEQEQADAREVLRWLAKQPWCTGAVGMMGISWGGFNALQLAALRPPELRAIITVCSTDDRYADDVHYRGGSVLALDMLSWGTAMLSYNAAPPDPAIVGERWREMWLSRLDGVEPYVHEWLRHQLRDDYWRHGSVCEDYAAIACPVYAIGGWADGYSDAVLRLADRLTVPFKGLIGPWGHAYPDAGVPGPAIDFAGECVRWWDRWLKGVENGVMDEPALRVWMQEPFAASASAAVRPGRWVSAERPLPEQSVDLEPTAGRSVATDLIVGADGGVWCADGGPADFAVDQRGEDGRSLCFDSRPIESRAELLGHGRVQLVLSGDRPVAQVAVRLCSVAPDGTSTLITRGVLNLTHRESHARPAPLEAGREYAVEVALDAIAQAVPAGHRLRVAVSPSYWPWLWPAPEPVTLTVTECGLVLAVSDGDCQMRDLGQPTARSGLKVVTLESDQGGRRLRRDYRSGGVELDVVWDQGGRVRYVRDAIEAGYWCTNTFRVSDGDPLSAEASCRCRTEWARAEVSVRVEILATMTCTAESFQVRTSLEAYEGDATVLERRWEFETPRLLG
jgi:predicted acyl esterase